MTLAHESFPSADDLVVWVNARAIAHADIQAIVMDSSGLAHLFYWVTP